MLCSGRPGSEISGGGKRVIVLGSAGMDRGTEYPTGADLLVFPYQGRAGIHRYMRRFLRRFRPAAVMADHFDDAFPPVSRSVNTKSFKKRMDERFPRIRVAKPAAGKAVEL